MCGLFSLTALLSLSSLHNMGVIQSSLSFYLTPLFLSCSVSLPLSLLCSLLFHFPLTPESWQIADLSLCATAMCRELIRTSIKSQRVHVGRKHNHLLVPLSSLSLLCDLLSYLITHSCSDWANSTTKDLADSQQKNTELLPNVPLHNWLHLMGLCMLKCHTHKRKMHAPM